MFFNFKHSTANKNLELTKSTVASVYFAILSIIFVVNIITLFFTIVAITFFIEMGVITNAWTFTTVSKANKAVFSVMKLD